MDRIVLDHMEFYGYHGCLPVVGVVGVWLFVVLSLQLVLRAAGVLDDLGQTVNYADVFTKIRGIVEGEPCQLIEAVAERIASMVLREYPRVQCVDVTVHKPSAPIPGDFRDVAVAITRERA